VLTRVADVPLQLLLQLLRLSVASFSLFWKSKRPSVAALGALYADPAIKKNE